MITCCGHFSTSMLHIALCVSQCGRLSTSTTPNAVPCDGRRAYWSVSTAAVDRLTISSPRSPSSAHDDVCFSKKRPTTAKGRSQTAPVTLDSCGLTSTEPSSRRPLFDSPTAITTWHNISRSRSARSAQAPRPLDHRRSSLVSLHRFRRSPR